MTVDTHSQGQPELTSQKKAWDAPKLTQLQAGSAEFERGTRADGLVDLS